MTYHDIKKARDSLLMDITQTAYSCPLEDKFKIIDFLDELLYKYDARREEDE